MTVVLVTGRRRPHQMVLLGLSVTLGLLYSLGTPPPRSLAAEMDPWLVDIWGVGLLLSGTVGLAGCLLPLHIERGLLLELGGMLLGAGALLIITVSIFSYAGWSGLFGGGFAAAWTLANLFRANQIRQDLRAIREM